MSNVSHDCENGNSTGDTSATDVAANVREERWLAVLEKYGNDERLMAALYAADLCLGPDVPIDQFLAKFHQSLAVAHEVGGILGDIW